MQLGGVRVYRFCPLDRPNFLKHYIPYQTLFLILVNSFRMYSSVTTGHPIITTPSLVIMQFLTSFSISTPSEPMTFSLPIYTKPLATASFFNVVHKIKYKLFNESYTAMYLFYTIFLFNCNFIYFLSFSFLTS